MPKNLTGDQDKTVVMLNDVYPCPPNPMVPPLGLIKAIAASMEDLDPIGPQYLRVDLLTRFEKAAFDGHRLKSIVDNNPVTWLETTDALSQAILRHLPCGDFFLDNAWAHLQVFWDWMSKRTSVQTLGHKLGEDELAEKGWVYLRKNMRIEYLDPRGTTYDYADLGREWAAFFLELERIRGRISQLCLRALAEGRVLAIKETSLGGQLMLPDDWRAVTSVPRKSDPLRFVLTCDLPESWLYANLGPRGKEERRKKTEALRWLNGLYQQVLPTGKKATKEDVFLQLLKRFEIRGTELQKEIWKEAQIDGWRKGGSPGMKKKYHFDNEG
ncbi:hypothetical protein DL239_19930 [Sedimentitalea sp. CY04]|uniref:Uncharacterized protein n=1 Tax=Parasedimentitalea denitrificans TaxID=2211118 RepID=A0ABX0WC55_9RHOB|nr:hypothetical protein [Sedimentitalea sp. CY04]NIZ63239.1 hypothetical protein [Sedimentitalea sp. CY04]